MGEGLIQAYFEHGPVQDIVSMEKEFRLTLPNGTPMVGFLDFIVDRGEGLEVVELKTAAPDRLAGRPHGASTIPRTWILKPPTPLDGLSSYDEHAQCGRTGWESVAAAARGLVGAWNDPDSPCR